MIYIIYHSHLKKNWGETRKQHPTEYLFKYEFHFQDLIFVDVSHVFFGFLVILFVPQKNPRRFLHSTPCVVVLLEKSTKVAGRLGLKSPGVDIRLSVPVVIGIIFLLKRWVGFLFQRRLGRLESLGEWNFYFEKFSKHFCWIICY